MIQALDRAVKLLRCFTAEEPELSVTEVSKRTGIAKSTASRFLHALADLGFLRYHEASGKFRLGLKLLELGGTLLASLDFRKLAWPYLRQLSLVSGFTVNLCVLDGYEAVTVAEVPNPGRLTLAGSFGDRAPLHCSSTGKGLLAFQDEEYVRSVLRRGLQRFTPYTCTDPAALVRQLNEIRQRGYSYNWQEWYLRATGVAAPFRNAAGEVAGVLNVAGFVDEIDDQKRQELGRLAIRYANRLSRSLGYTMSNARPIRPLRLRPR